MADRHPWWCDCDACCETPESRARRIATNLIIILVLFGAAYGLVNLGWEMLP